MLSLMSTTALIADEEFQNSDSVVSLINEAKLPTSQCKSIPQQDTVQ
jgi:hypothetical protein